jgi:hypothetical protein
VNGRLWLGIVAPAAVIVAIVLASAIEWRGPSAQSSGAPQAGASWEETFDGGADGWETFEPGWEAVRGVYKGTNTQPNVPTESVYANGYGWTDYAVEADVSMLGGYTPADVQLLLRYVSSGYDGTQFEMVSCKLMAHPGRHTVVLQAPDRYIETPFEFEIGKTYRLRASAVGEKLTCEVVGRPETRLEMETAGSRTGTVGFRNTHVPGEFDNIAVTMLGE